MPFIPVAPVSNDSWEEHKAKCFKCIFNTTIQPVHIPYVTLYEESNVFLSKELQMTEAL